MNSFFKTKSKIHIDTKLELTYHFDLKFTNYKIPILMLRASFLQRILLFQTEMMMMVTIMLVVGAPLPMASQ